MEVISNDDFCSKLTEFLDANNRTEVINLLTDPKYETNVKNTIMSIVTSLTSYLTLENQNNNKDLLETCQKAVDILAEKQDETDVLLAILQQMENDNDIKYCILLEPLLTIFRRHHKDSWKFLEWTASTIKSYIISIPKLETKDKSDDETINNEYQYNLEQVSTVYKATIKFLLTLKDIVSPNARCAARNYVLSIGIFMFGPPFCFIDDTSWSKMEDGTNLLDRLVTLVVEMSRNLFDFFDVIERRSRGRERKHCANDLFDPEEQVPNISYSNLFSIVFLNDDILSTLPQVYSQEYILHSSLFMTNCLLEKVDYPEHLLLKGIKFIRKVLNRVDKGSISAGALELKIHKNFLDVISRLMIYCNSQQVRKSALEIFQMYIDIFSLKAKYFLVSYLYDNANHSGLLSQVTGIFKKSVLDCLDQNTNEFLGEKMKVLLKKACKLENGVMTELIEVSDEIISSLNLIRFLIIKDRDNKTGIWDYVPELKTNFLEPLRDAIEVTRVRWKAKLDDLKKQRRQKKDSTEKISIYVGGENLQMLPVEQKVNVCLNALNALDVMQSILIRIHERFEKPIELFLKS